MGYFVIVFGLILSLMLIMLKLIWVFNWKWFFCFNSILHGNTSVYNKYKYVFQ